MFRYLIILAILVFAAAATFFLPTLERKHRRGKLKDRPVLSDADIISRFYSGYDIQKDAIIDFWHRISEILHVDAGKLRPDDKLIDLRGTRFSLFNDLDVLEHFIKSQIRKGAKGPEKSETIDNVIRYLLLNKK